MKKVQELSFAIEKLAPQLCIEEILGSIDGLRLAIQTVFPLFSAEIKLEKTVTVYLGVGIAQSA
jgi:hypothetical protein